MTTQIQDDVTPLRVRIPAGHPGFDIDSDIMIDQIRAIDNLRFYRGDTHIVIKKISPAADPIMRETERCLRLLLDIS